MGLRCLLSWDDVGEGGQGARPGYRCCRRGRPAGSTPADRRRAHGQRHSPLPASGP
ncbi:hypothetical protein BZL30_4921 [Mycobacterium kansasii]|uniref:Uncharacterized protein n=1 Tax=Mycobacterium kansasii TaxID=1768 RepID=A0A1V3X4H9_MYCKA|nr:hypothetical protein BZL30_4921 [Mycobacterium kansasii]